jgi:hypothetical protein
MQIYQYSAGTTAIVRKFFQKSAVLEMFDRRGAKRKEEANRFWQSPRYGPRSSQLSSFVGSGQRVSRTGLKRGDTHVNFCIR